MDKKSLGILILLFVTSAILGVYFVFYKDKIPPDKNGGLIERTCLSDNEHADYKLTDNQKTEDSAVIIVKDKDTGNEKLQFTIHISNANHYHPLELHKCGIYAVRTFGYDFERSVVLNDYRRELWKYSYDGAGGKKIFSDPSKLSTENILGDFRVDPNENYLTLLRGYLGSTDYAIVVKDLKSSENIFILTMAEIKSESIELVGNIQFDDWTKDGRYLWVKTHQGAVTLGFIRINVTNWNVDLLKAPEDVLGGDALNLENGWITVHPSNIWFGSADLDEEERERRRKGGIGTDLYIENLFTKERRFVTHTDEPLWYFKPKWLTDTELQYTLPSGEAKIFTIPK